MRGSLREKAPGRWELRVPLPPDPVTGKRRRRSASFEGTERQAQRDLARRGWLRWIGLDHARRTAKIRRSVVDVAGQVIVEDTKTHAQRVIALDPGTMDRLQMHREFVGDRVKVGVPNARLHDLRHFVATQLISSGHDIRTVSGRLGHAKTSTTLDIYVAFLEPNDRHTADTLGELPSGDDA